MSKAVAPARGGTAPQMHFEEPSDEDIQRRLKFVDFAATDLGRLKSMAPMIEESADDLANRFFEYLARFPEANGLTRDPARLEQARRLKKEHLRAMVNGTLDAKYVADRLERARIYAGAGIETKVFLGAFHHLMASIGLELMERAKGSDPIEAFKTFMALKRIAFFDLTVITDGMINERERTIRQQREAIHELSTPVLQVRDRLLIIPLIGMVDTHRARQLTEGMLKAIREHRARAVVMDVTGVPLVDSKVANHFAQACEAARLMGAHVILSGISSEIAQALVNIGAELKDVPTVSDLQSGIEEAERLLEMSPESADGSREDGRPT